MYDFVTFTGGVMLYKDDLEVQGNKIVATSEGLGSLFMKQDRYCASDSVMRLNELGQSTCLKCPDQQGSSSPQSTYCSTCGTMWHEGDCKTYPRQYQCLVAAQLCSDPQSVYFSENPQAVAKLVEAANKGEEELEEKEEEATKEEEKKEEEDAKEDGTTETPTETGEGDQTGGDE